MSHSKRNTTRAVFTAYERNLAKSAWSTNSATLTRDSFLPFASCKLCLMPAQSPVSCSHGDIFCRECALSNILSQKQEIKRAEKSREKEAREGDEDQDRLDAEAKTRAVREFERVQMGLEGRGKAGGASVAQKIVGMDDGKSVGEEDADVGGSVGGRKRKFELDEDELLRIAKEERTKARKAIDDEKASKTTLPSFWVPSITPTSNTTTTLHTIIKPPKSTPICPSSAPSNPHTYSLATLITVQFTEEESSPSTTTSTSTKTTPQRICPSCKKALSNTSKATLAKPCGHVLCKNCVLKFMVPLKDTHAAEEEQGRVRCFVCEADLTERKEKSKGSGGKESKKGKEKIQPGLVEINSEGTGFASGGGSLVKKDNVSFQC